GGAIDPERSRHGGGAAGDRAKRLGPHCRERPHPQHARLLKLSQVATHPTSDLLLLHRLETADERRRPTPHRKTAETAPPTSMPWEKSEVERNSDVSVRATLRRFGTPPCR